MSHFNHVKYQLGNSAIYIPTRSMKKTSDSLRGVYPIPVPRRGERLFTYKWHNVERYKGEEKYYVISIKHKKVLRCLPTMNDCVKFIDSLVE
ncbi:MAG: hypothetical protein IKF77_02645 [Thermoguttaceae bacterium]|nr:hypothetical protein [Thermoguttaceae bacterium]MBR3218796.1 hypothetical protein [Thermoguttaceae bacterium]